METAFVSLVALIANVYFCKHALAIMQGENTEYRKNYAELLTQFRGFAEQALGTASAKSVTEHAEAEAIKARTNADIEFLRSELAKDVPMADNDSRNPPGTIVTPSGRRFGPALL